MIPDTLGDKCKIFEQLEASRKTMPLLPVMARLDGKNFHRWTKGLSRPFDENFSRLMAETAKFLVEETHAKIGYSQSDEISLVFYTDPNNIRSTMFFDGKYQKLVSVLASMATAQFNVLVPKYLPSKISQLAFFDCRVWQVPSLQEAANVFLWRELDCSKNSVSMLAQSLFSHSELQGKSQSQMHEMLHTKGVNWNDYPAWAKRGTWITRKSVLIDLTPEELAKIPEKYHPSTKVMRTRILELEMPSFNRVTNRVGVVFENQEPLFSEI